MGLDRLMNHISRLNEKETKMSEIRPMWLEEFSTISDKELAHLASRVAEESREKAANPGYCIMMACQKLILSNKRTPDQLSETLTAFLRTCEDKTLMLSMRAAADGFAGRKSTIEQRRSRSSAGSRPERRKTNKVEYLLTILAKFRDKYLLPLLAKIKDFLAPTGFYFLAFWKQSVRYFLKVMS
jgi:hypothetical protein